VDCVSIAQCTLAAAEQSEQSHKANEICLQVSEKTVGESLAGLAGPLHKLADFLIKFLAGEVGELFIIRIVHGVQKKYKSIKK